MIEGRKKKKEKRKKKKEEPSMYSDTQMVLPFVKESSTELQTDDTPSIGRE